MPNLIVPFVTDVAADVGNRFLYTGSASKLGIQCFYARVRYNGSAWEVSLAMDSCGIVTGNLTWGSPLANRLNIAVSNFTATPLVILGRVTANAYVPFAAPSSGSSNVAIGFSDFAGAEITTQSTAMDCAVFICGV